MVVDDVADEDCPDCAGTVPAGSSGTETTRGDES
jgi:hypothetical protein